MSFEVNTGTAAADLDGTEKIPISQGGSPFVIQTSRFPYYDGVTITAEYSMRIDTGGTASTLLFGDPSGSAATLTYTPGGNLLEIRSDTGRIKDVTFGHNVLAWTGVTVTLGATTVPATATFSNSTGVNILDTNSSHTLTIVVGSDLTSNRTFTLTTGNANRTLDISASNVTISAAGAALIDDADAAAQRTTLGLGTSATQNTGTSGANVPLLNGNNTYSGTADFSGSQILVPPGTIGSAIGVAFHGFTDTGFEVNGDNLCVVESGVLQLVLSTLNAEFRVPSGTKFAWSSQTDNLNSADTTIERFAAGVSGPNGPWRLKSYTASALPAAATAGAGALAYVSDANATTRLSTVAGSGSNKVIVFSDGSNWLIL